MRNKVPKRRENFAPRGKVLSASPHRRGSVRHPHGRPVDGSSGQPKPAARPAGGPLDYYHQFVSEAGDDHGLRHETALAHFKSGPIAAKLGATNDAIAAYRAAKKLLSQLTAAEPGNEEVSSQIAVTHNNLGLLLAARGETAEALLKCHDAAVAIQRRLLRNRARQRELHRSARRKPGELGMLHDQLGDTGGAQRSLSAAIDLLRSIPTAQDQDPKFARNLAIVHNNLSYVLRCTTLPRRPRCAAKPSRSSRTASRPSPPATPNIRTTWPCATTTWPRSRVKTSAGTRRSAWHVRAIALQDQMTRKAPSVVRHQAELAAELNNLGVAYAAPTARPTPMPSSSATVHCWRRLPATTPTSWPTAARGRLCLITRRWPSRKPGGMQSAGNLSNRNHRPARMLAATSADHG